MLLATGQYGEALTAFQHATSIGRRLGDRGTEAIALDETGRAYREMGRLVEAADFHRLAASTHGDLGDLWRRANALDNLAYALDQLGDRAGALVNWREAESCLTEFSDRRATALRSSISANLRRDDG